MLTREDLEGPGHAWKPGEGQRGREVQTDQGFRVALVSSEEADPEESTHLLAASPKFALACLAARKLILVLIGTNLLDRDGMPGEVLDMIELALNGARVEIPK